MLRDYRPRPWDKDSPSPWGNLSLSNDGIFEPKKKESDSGVKVGITVSKLILNGMARKGYLTYAQVEKKDAHAISTGVLKILEEWIYGRVRAARKF